MDKKPANILKKRRCVLAKFAFYKYLFFSIIFINRVYYRNGLCIGCKEYKENGQGFEVIATI
jgi:hypothetical protein